MQAVVPPGALEDVAARTERDVARVLTVAARADGPAAEQKVVELARSMSSVNAAAHVPTESRSLARSLNAQARAAWQRQDVQRALALQQRAFRANPNDPEVAGNLAYFYLKVQPAKPALARKLALYALAARGRGFPAGRMQDWGTLAVASALDGREADAVKAMYVMSTVTRDPERACRAAQLAVEQYGPAMRAPARAMMVRMKARGVTSHAPSCG
jgi:Flp pilus assembly protein TadD